MATRCTSAVPAAGWCLVLPWFHRHFATAISRSACCAQDHAWGGNYFALGGAVNGGKLFGELPSPLLDTSDRDRHLCARRRLGWRIDCGADRPQHFAQRHGALGERGEDGAVDLDDRESMEAVEPWLACVAQVRAWLRGRFVFDDFAFLRPVFGRGGGVIAYVLFGRAGHAVGRFLREARPLLGSLPYVLITGGTDACAPPATPQTPGGAGCSARGCAPSTGQHGS